MSLFMSLSLSFCHCHCHCHCCRYGRSRDTWMESPQGNRSAQPPIIFTSICLLPQKIILKWRCSHKFTLFGMTHSLRRHRHPLQISIKVVIRQRYKADMSEVVMEIKGGFFRRLKLVQQRRCHSLEGGRVQLFIDVTQINL